MEKLGLHENLPGNEVLVKTASVSTEIKIYTDLKHLSILNRKYLL